jgi:hypothetical protein
MTAALQWPMVEGRDGKPYPGWALRSEDRDYLIELCRHRWAAKVEPSR